MTDLAAPPTRSDWTVDEVREIYGRPFLQLVHEAAEVHRRHFDPAEVQVCQLVSIKTGGCPEDCGYCSQSVHNDSGLKPQPLMGRDEVTRIARRAKRNGVTRLCLGVRGAVRDATVNRFLKHVAIPAADLDAARVAGALLGRVGGSATVDALVVAVAAERPGAVVVTVDADDVPPLAEAAGVRVELLKS